MKRVLAACIILHLWLIPGLAADTKQIFEQGQHAMNAGDLAAAEKAFRAVLAADPDNVGAHGNLAVVHMRQKQWKAALAELQSAERLAPKMPGIRLNIGLVYYRQADYRLAIQPFESVLRDQTDSTQARYLLGLCYFFTERYGDAAQVLEPLWPNESGNLNYLYVMSIAANKAGRAELDQRATARLIEVGRDSAEFHLIVGKAHLAHELYSSALDEFSQAARLDPKLPFVHYFLGAVYRKQNELEVAKQEFLKDTAIEPDVAYNYDALGAVCYSLNQIPEAERYFREALRLDSGQAASAYGLAKIYKQQGKYPAALDMLRAAGDIDPHSASVYYLRGQTLLAMGRRQQAKSEFAEAARLQQATRDELERQISGQHPADPQLAHEGR
jgi:tetratricopeptide (TPR) repeat protein